MKLLDLCILALVGILALNHKVISTSDGQISDDTSTQDDYYQDQSTSLIDTLEPDADAAVTGYDYENTHINQTDLATNRSAPLIHSALKKAEKTEEFIGITSSDSVDLAETDDELSEESSSEPAEERVDYTTAQADVADEDVIVEDTATESVQVFTVNADAGEEELLGETTQMSVLNDEELGSGDASDVIRLGAGEVTTNEAETSEELTTGAETTGGDLATEAGTTSEDFTTELTTSMLLFGLLYVSLEVSILLTK